MSDRAGQLQEQILRLLDGGAQLTIELLFEKIEPRIGGLPREAVAKQLGQLAHEGKVHSRTVEGPWTIGSGVVPQTQDYEEAVLAEIKRSPAGMDEIIFQLSCWRGHTDRNQSAYCLGRLEAKGKIWFSFAASTWLVV